MPFDWSTPPNPKSNNMKQGTGWSGECHWRAPARLCPRYSPQILRLSRVKIPGWSRSVIFRWPCNWLERHPRRSRESHKIYIFNARDIFTVMFQNFLILYEFDLCIKLREKLNVKNYITIRAKLRWNVHIHKWQINFYRLPWRRERNFS